MCVCSKHIITFRRSTPSWAAESSVVITQNQSFYKLIISIGSQRIAAWHEMRARIKAVARRKYDQPAPRSGPTVETMERKTMEKRCVLVATLQSDYCHMWACYEPVYQLSKYSANLVELVCFYFYVGNKRQELVVDSGDGGGGEQWEEIHGKQTTSCTSKICDVSKDSAVVQPNIHVT